MNKRFILISIALFVLTAGISVPALSQAKAINLSKAEAEWLSAHPVIRVAPDPDFAPIEYFDELDMFQGIAADYLEILEQKIGIQFKVIRSKSWDDSIEMLKQHRADIFSAATNSDQRGKYASFTRPHIVLPGAIIAKENFGENIKLEQLKNKKVAIVSGYVWQEWVERDHPQINIIPVSDVVTGLQKVSFGQVDAMVANLATATDSIRKNGITNLYVAGMSGYSAKLAIATRKDWPLLVSILDKAIASVDPQQKQIIFDKWISLNHSQSPFTKTIWVVLAAFIAATLLLVAGVLFWNKALRAAVDRKTREIKISENRLSGIINNTTALIYVKDLDSKFILINKQLEELFGIKNEELVGKTASHIVPPEVAEQHRQNDLEVIKAGKPIESEETAPLADGMHTYLSVKFCLFDEADEPYAICGISTDITERKNTEKLLQESEARYKDISNKMPGVVYQVKINPDKSIEIPFLSEGFAEFSGISREEAMANPKMAFASVLEEDLPAVQAAMHSSAENMTRSNIVFRMYDKNKEVRWFQVSSDPALLEDGSVLKNGVMLDITERKQIEETLKEHQDHLEELVEQRSAQLKESESRLSQVLSSSPVVIYTCETEGDYAATYISNNVEQLFGYKPEAFLEDSKFWANGIHPDDAPQVFDGLGKLFEEGSYSHEYRFRLVSGDYVWVHDELKLLYDKDGKPVEIIGYWVDISVRKNFEQALVDAKLEAEQANQAKSKFLSNMSHELRTPMNAIMGFSQLLQADTRTPLNEHQQDNVGEIIKAGTHLMELINDVLDLSRIEAGHVSFSIEPVELADVISDCLKLVFTLAQNRNIKIQLTLNGDEVSFESFSKDVNIVTADRTRLKQAILNLLNNSIKYNHDGGNVTIDCSGKPGSYVRVGITDTGDGLNEKQLRNIFNPYERLGAEDSSIEGTGIGLMITKNIIELMGGKIGVDSKEGIGSTFWIDLPVNEYANSKNLDVEASNIKSEGKSKLTGKYNVLYIEDNPANLRLVAQVLGRRSNIHMISAEEPVQGIDLAESTVPDLILLDINLPGIDGYEVLKRLRKNKVTVNIPVVAISANAMPQDIKKGLKAGFYDYITKPIDISSLLQTIDVVLSKKAV